MSESALIQYEERKLKKKSQFFTGPNCRNYSTYILWWETSTGNEREPKCSEAKSDIFVSRGGNGGGITWVSVDLK